MHVSNFFQSAAYFRCIPLCKYRQTEALSRSLMMCPSSGGHVYVEAIHHFWELDHNLQQHDHEMSLVMYAARLDISLY